MNKKKYGIYEMAKVPDKDKPKRAFLLSGTLGNNKEALRDEVYEKMKEYSPMELDIPKHIKNVEAFLQRWDLGIFYKIIKKFLWDSSNTGREIPFTGDIDTFIPFYGHILFIEQKTTLNGMKAAQLVSYLKLANKYDTTIWYLIGATPNPDSIRDSSRKYKLCVIKPLGQYDLFEGSLEDVLGYFELWLNECFEKPIIDDFPYSEVAQQILNDVSEQDKYQDLSIEVLFKERMRKI